VDDIEDVFERFDKDESGFIELRELDGFLAAMGLDSTSDRTLMALAKLETAEHGRVSLGELQAWWAGPASVLALEPVPGEETTRELRELFERFDADGDGTIDVDELTELLDSTDLGFTEESVYAAIQSVDRNGNGVMEWSEFLHFWTIVDRGA
jgi:Ca2+-binding EF-hand superfamily protein